MIQQAFASIINRNPVVCFEKHAGLGTSVFVNRLLSDKVAFQQKTSLLLLPLEHLYVSLRDGHHLRQNFLNMQVLHFVPEDCRDAVVAVVMVVAAVCDHAGANAEEVLSNRSKRTTADWPRAIDGPCIYLQQERVSEQSENHNQKPRAKTESIVMRIPWSQLPS